MSGTEEKPFWVVLALIGLLLLPLIFIIGLVVGINVDGNVNLSTDTMSSWVGAISTLAIAVLTFILARETWYLRLAQIKQINELRKEAIRPNLEFYLLSAPASFQFMNIHIENNGKGVARNIRFKFSGENDSLFTDNEQSVVNKLNSLNILRNGMLALGSGKQRKSFIFSFIELNQEMGDTVFNIKISISMSYEDAEGRQYESESIIDFSEYKGVVEIGGGDPIYNLYQETKKIREIFQNAQGSMSSKRININSFSSQDRKAEQDEIRKRIEEQRSAKSS